MDEYVFSMTQLSHLYILLLGAGTEIHALYVNGDSTCIIDMIQDRDKIGTTIIDTFRARLFEEHSK